MLFASWSHFSLVELWCPTGVPSLPGDPSLPDRNDVRGARMPQSDMTTIEAYRRMALIRRFEEQALPLLGICRGIQAINVALGGTLVEDIPITDVVHAAQEAPPTPGSPDHVVITAADSTVRRVYGGAVQTNSLHHQAVKHCGPGVFATGWTRDGSIESIEMTGHPVLGVQWHPEWHLALDPVFPWLVQAAQTYRLATSTRAESSRL